MTQAEIQDVVRGRVKEMVVLAWRTAAYGRYTFSSQRMPDLRDELDEVDAAFDRRDDARSGTWERIKAHIMLTNAYLEATA